MGIFSSTFAKFSKQLDSHIKELDPPSPGAYPKQSNKPVSKKPFVSLVSGAKFGFKNYGDTERGQFKSLISGNSRKS